MAYLIVKIEDENSLLLNEFYDYNGYCYSKYEVNLQDFYEASINTRRLDDVTVIFITFEAAKIIGWYSKASVSSEIENLSVFLQGNIKALASDVKLLNTPLDISDENWYMSNSVYEVIEEEDVRFQILKEKLSKDNSKNIFKRYPYIQISIDPQSRKSVPVTRQYCEIFAGNIMEDNCIGIQEIKALKMYSMQLIELDRNDADGYYYHSLACFHLGFVKEAIRAIEKAISIEGESSDLIAQKANVLCSMKHYDAAQMLYRRAYELSNDEIYIIYQGKALMLEGQMQKAYQVFGQITNKQLLTDCGIDTKIDSMDKKWSFSTIFKRLKRD